MSKIKSKIIELKEQGYNIPQISKILNKSKSTIHYHIVNSDCDKDVNFKNITEEQIDIIKKSYINNSGNLSKTSMEIDFCSKNIIRLVLRDCGLYNIYKKDEIARKKQKSNNVLNWKKNIKLKLIEYKGGKCVICGYNKCETALEFHHLNPKSKDFSISNNSFSFEKMKLETDKCILVCANCHREIHYLEKLKAAVI
jgi:hypothetical protein